MPPARCSRCGINSYGGEITIDIRKHGASGVKAYSLCGYCLPIIAARINGIIESDSYIEDNPLIISPVRESLIRSIYNANEG